MKKQIIDQTAHFVFGALVIATATALGASFGLASGAFVGFALGLLREITEPDPVFTPFSLTDILFWALGGAFAGLMLN